MKLCFSAFAMAVLFSLCASCPLCPSCSSSFAADALLPGIRIDTADSTIEIETRIVLREGVLELLLCQSLSKEHESILATEARASHVHAALLALGLDAGKPGHWLSAPGGEAVYVPPDGARLEIVLRYRDADGSERQAAPRDWVVRQEDGKTVESIEWVFVGAAPVEGGGYWGDQTGDVISLANFPASVIDVPFASSRQAARLQFAARTEAIPPIGTPVTVIIRPRPGAEQAAVAGAVLEIDAAGRFLLDGRAVRPAGVETWAESFRARHERPYVLVLAAGEALAGDIGLLRQLLERAGIDDVDVQTRPPAGEVLPRTAAGAHEALADWRGRLARGADDWGDPAHEAQAVLAQVERRRRELHRLLEVLDAYAQQLTLAIRDSRRPQEPDATPTTGAQDP